MAAALAAAEKGAKVMLLEKRSATGGTSVCASGLFAFEARHREGWELRLRRMMFLK